MSAQNENIVICAAKRTAVGSFMGSLGSTPAPTLGAHAIKAVLEESSLSADAVDEVIMGCVLSAGLGQAPARQAAIQAGLPPSVQAMTVNKVCSSGLKAVLLAANNVRLGISRSVIAGGMENMSQAPYLLPAFRTGGRLGHSQAQDSIITDGLWDVYNNQHMGNCAELCAKEHGISREEQDNFAVSSYARANKAIADGCFTEEIAPITVRQGRAEVEFAVDEEPGKGKPDKIPQLKPVFQKDGTVTAANASSINDGAAAMLVCSESFAAEHKLQPLAVMHEEGWHSQAPEWFTTAPIGAVEKLLERSGKTLGEIDLFEINEAFSAVALCCGSKLGIDPEKLNIHGGAVAIGHPIGASGARILTTLIYALRRQNGKYGVAAICNGGGEATSLLIERV